MMKYHQIHQTLIDYTVALNITYKNKTFQCSKFRKVIIGKEPMFTITQHSFSIKVQSAWCLFLLFLLENEGKKAGGSGKLLTLDNTDKYTCLLGGIV